MTVIYIVEWKLTEPDDESFVWRREYFQFKWQAENFMRIFTQYAKALRVGIGFKEMTNLDDQKTFK